MGDKATPAEDRRDFDTQPAREKQTKGLRPVDAASLIIVDNSGPVKRVLMGQRRHDLVFMAGKFVFPGGRVDRTDAKLPVADDLHEVECNKLLLEMKGKPSVTRARALALAAVRESFEETGVVIGKRLGDDDAARAAASAAAQQPIWQQFYGTGYAPSLGPLRLLARAITPPGRPRRFDTRFFYITADAISEQVESRDEELLGVDWLTMDQARELDLAAITRAVIEDLNDLIESGGIEDARAPVPFYYQLNGSPKRDLLRE